MTSFQIKLEKIQPSQLYVSKEKLTQVMRSYTTGSEQTLPPVPVKKLNGHRIYTDGHTRALAAYLNGQQSITVVWDEDELDWEAYQICVEWCLNENIRSVADLLARIIEPSEYQSLWLERYRQMQCELERQRAENK